MLVSTSGPAGNASVAALALGLVLQAGVSAAQPSDFRDNIGPPAGQFAPPPSATFQPYSSSFRSQDEAYSAAFNRWAARYCVDQRNNNAAAGAVIGGALGALFGSGVAGRGNRTGGAIVGGALGATAGAAIGSASSSSRCPPGFVVAPGAPAFVFPGYRPVFGPSWYDPWVFAGGRWTYRPYRHWYYGHSNYWRPGWGGRGRRF